MLHPFGSGRPGEGTVLPSAVIKLQRAATVLPPAGYDRRGYAAPKIGGRAERNDDAARESRRKDVYGKLTGTPGRNASVRIKKGVYVQTLGLYCPFIYFKRYFRKIPVFAERMQDNHFIQVYKFILG